MSAAYVKVSVGDIAKHTGDDEPFMEGVQVVLIRPAGPGTTKREHVGS